MPPSPVLCRHPVAAAPRFMDSMAAALSAPKLIPEMLTSGGRKAWLRPRRAPSTLAPGTVKDGSGRASPKPNGKAAWSTIR